MNAHQLWQTLRTPVILLALVALVVLGALWGWQQVIKPPAVTLPDDCVVQPVTDGQLRSDQVTVEVHNSGSRRGLAGEVGTLLEQKAFVVGEVGNAEEIRATDVVVVGADAEAPEVRLVASQFANPEVRAEPGRLADHRVVVVLGDEFSGMQADAAATVAVEAETICLPALPVAEDAAAGD